MINESILVPEYEKYADEFNPIKFDASEWVGHTKQAGMKYIVITSNNNDGIGLWDSKISDYDIVEKHSRICLEKAFHDIELQYFDDSEGEFLELTFDSKEIPKQKIPASYLYLIRE